MEFGFEFSYIPLLSIQLAYAAVRGTNEVSIKL